MNKTYLERFCEKIDINSDGCWIWNAYCSSFNGYGRFKSDLNTKQAHLWAWNFVFGPIPEGLVYRHGKGCPANCVNPMHAREPGTQRQNILDQLDDGTHKELKKTHCKRGHEFNGKNTYIRNNGKRMCRPCANYIRRVK